MRVHLESVLNPLTHSEMNNKIFLAHMLLPGTAESEVLVLTEPLSLWGGLNPETAEVTDRRYPQSGQFVNGRILVLGAAVARELYATSPPVLVLETADYAHLQTGQRLTVSENGVIELLAQVF